MFVYFVRDHTRPTVPRDRSAAALRDVGEVPEILVCFKQTGKGKGLSIIEKRRLVEIASVLRCTTLQLYVLKL